MTGKRSRGRGNRGMGSAKGMAAGWLLFEEGEGEG